MKTRDKRNRSDRPPCAPCAGARAIGLLILIWMCFGAVAAPVEALEVTPVVDAEYHPALEALLASATRSVDLVAFEFLTESGAVRKIAGRLVEMKQANPGLRIRVFLEGDKRGLGDRNRRTRGYLQRNGIEASLDAAGCTTHAKAVAVDGESLLIGSTNLSNTSLFRNNEANLLVRSPELASAFTTYFDHLLAAPATPVPQKVAAGPVTLLTDGDYFPALRELFARTRTSLDVVMYSCDFEPGRQTLVNEILAEVAALAPRVRVRVLLEQSTRFSPHISSANRQAARYLLEHGVREVFFDRADKFSHAKVVVRDGEEVLLGSTNWFQREFDLSHQVDLLVAQPETARFFQEYIDRKIREEGTPAGDHPPVPASPDE